MFVLRQIDKETKRESNFCLGNVYTHVHAGNAKESFVGCLSLLDWMTEPAKEQVYAVVTDDSGRMHPLSETSENYIMTDSGQTFARV